MTIDIPDWPAKEFAKAGKEPVRAVLEAVAIDGYRTGRFGDGGAAQVLGYGTRMQLHDLLKEYDVYLDYSAEDLKEDMATARLLAQEAGQSKPAGHWKLSLSCR